MDKNLDIIRKLLKKLRNVYTAEGTENDLPNEVDVSEAIKAFNNHKKDWEEKQSKQSPIEKRMAALEEVVRKSLAEPARRAGPPTVSGQPAQKTCASVVAPPIEKTAVRIRVEGSEKNAGSRAAFKG